MDTRYFFRADEAIKFVAMDGMKVGSEGPKRPIYVQIGH